MNTSLFLAAAITAGGFAFAAGAHAAQPGAQEQPKSLMEYFNKAGEDKAAKPAKKTGNATKSVVKSSAGTMTAKVSTKVRTTEEKRNAGRVRVVIDPRARGKPFLSRGENVASLKTNLKLSSSASAYNPIISRYASQYGVPVSLAHAVIRVESNYRPTALGGAGEIGLMQIKPATARMLGYSGSAKGLYNPETNIRYGMKYLAMAHKLGGGDTCGTILRYNAGHGATRMNPISAAYCGKVKAHLGR